MAKHPVIMLDFSAYETPLPSPAYDWTYRQAVVSRCFSEEEAKNHKIFGMVAFAKKVKWGTQELPLEEWHASIQMVTRTIRLLKPTRVIAIGHAPLALWMQLGFKIRQKRDKVTLTVVNNPTRDTEVYDKLQVFKILSSVFRYTSSPDWTMDARPTAKGDCNAMVIWLSMNPAHVFGEEEMRQIEKASGEMDFKISRVMKIQLHDGKNGRLMLSQENIEFVFNTVLFAVEVFNNGAPEADVLVIVTSAVDAVAALFGLALRNQDQHGSVYAAERVGKTEFSYKLHRVVDKGL